MRSNITNIFTLLIVGITLLWGGSGCGFSVDQLNPAEQSSTVVLMKVIIHFDNQEQLETWVKDLGISENEELYAGGASKCYYYDQDGNIKGSYNYQKVTYIERVE